MPLLPMGIVQPHNFQPRGTFHETCAGADGVGQSATTGCTDRNFLYMTLLCHLHKTRVRCILSHHGTTGVWIPSCQSLLISYSIRVMQFAAVFLISRTLSMENLSKCTLGANMLNQTRPAALHKFCAPPIEYQLLSVDF